MKNRVSYFSENDFAFENQYEKAKQRLPLLLKNIGNWSLLDVLELAQIGQYMQSSRAKVGLDGSISKINGCVGKWFSTVESRSLVRQIKETNLSSAYQKALWRQLSRMKLNKNVMTDIIKLYLGHLIVYPLMQSTISKHFGQVCCDVLIQNFEAIPIVLDPKSHGVILPNEIDKSFRSQYFMKFVQSENPNSGYLKTISLDRKTNKDVRIAAKQRYEDEVAKYFKENPQNALRQETAVFIDPSLDPSVLISPSQKDENGVYKTRIAYSAEALKDLIDWPTILNNFIYVFGFIDNDGILTIAPKNEQGSIFERLLTTQKSDLYEDSSVLQNLSTLINLQFYAYYSFLKQEGIRLEDVLEWFFSKYLVENFGIEGLSINLPKETDRGEVKALVAATQLHRIIRMYNLLANDSNFDRELINEFSSTPTFDEIPSKIQNKYMLVVDDYLLGVERLLFSDQSFMPSEGNVSFGDMIYQGKIKMADLQRHHKQYLESMFKNKLLVMDGEIVRFSSKNWYLFLRSDFDYGAVPYSWIMARRPDFSVMVNLVDEGRTKWSPTLLTKKEAAVFDYYFSDLYPNGQGLRNKYAHGASNNLTEKEHIGNYLIFLMFIVFLVIKINFDLEEALKGP
ncbi:hypothetical protein [Secundilactobacillus kimchicus]|uniref:hypothetical protein n=1 Tax=Secundilactobacillus kimchicus TaxID=528209 RepID=UPI0024A82560|nr:hypothetical protein [Secundilactobacillus kimchicus]